MCWYTLLCAQTRASLCDCGGGGGGGGGAEFYSQHTTIAILHFRRCICYSTPGLPENKLTLGDLGLLQEELVLMYDRWYHLGLQLKVSPETQDSIRAQFSDPRDQLLEMLKVWLTTSDNTSWKAIIDALRSRSVQQSSLAANLEAKYKMEETEVHESKCWKYVSIVTLPREQSLLLASMILPHGMFPGCLKVELP